MWRGAQQLHLAWALYAASLLYALSVIVDARRGLNPDLSSQGLWRRYEAPRPDPRGGEALLIDARPAPLADELKARFGVEVGEGDLSTPARARDALGGAGEAFGWRGGARALPGGAEVALVWAGRGAPRLIVGRYDARWVWVGPDGVRLGPTPLRWEGAPTLPLTTLRGRPW